MKIIVHLKYLLTFWKCSVILYCENFQICRNPSLLSSTKSMFKSCLLQNKRCWGWFRLAQKVFVWRFCFIAQKLPLGFTLLQATIVFLLIRFFGAISMQHLWYWSNATSIDVIKKCYVCVIEEMLRLCYWRNATSVLLNKFYICGSLLD